MLGRLRKRKDDRGFTLIELLIVIIVLGILVAIVLFGLGTFRGQSQAAACKADTKQLTTAETAYFAKHNASGTVAQLVTDGFLQSKPSSTADGVALSVSATGGGTVSVTGTCPTG